MKEAQNQLQRAKQSELQGDLASSQHHAHSAIAILGEVTKVIASKSPELAAALLGMSQGYSAMELTEVQRHEYTEAVERRFLGVHLYTDHVPRVDITRKTRTIRFHR